MTFIHHTECGQMSLNKDSQEVLPALCFYYPSTKEVNHLALHTLKKK